MNLEISRRSRSLHLSQIASGNEDGRREVIAKRIKEVTSIPFFFYKSVRKMLAGNMKASEPTRRRDWKIALITPDVAFVAEAMSWSSPIAQVVLVVR